MQLTISLLKNHTIILARISLLKLLFSDNQNSQALKGNGILSMVFNTLPTDDTQPDGGRKRVSTAEHFEMKHSKESWVESKKYEQWQKDMLLELQRLEACLQLYDVAMRALTDEERVFVRAYYDEGRSFQELSNTSLGGRAPISVSTLKRINARVLAKISKVLSTGI